MPDKFLKISYIVSFVADNALAQLRAQLEENAKRPFTTAKELLEVLTVAFGNFNRKQEARSEYWSLYQGTGDFKSFWAEFQRLALELDHSKATLIEDLIKKSHHSIQLQLVTGHEHTDLLQLAKHCQRIELGLKQTS